jgi:hypothetical protein
VKWLCCFELGGGGVRRKDEEGVLKDNIEEIETHLLNEEEVETSKASITCNTSY